MRRTTATRRGGALGTTVGVVAVALSSALMLAAGPRILGTHSFSGLAIAWTATAVFGFGLAAPTEQLIIRRLNAGAPHAVRPPMTVLAVLGVLAIVGCAVLGYASSTRHAFHPLTATMVVGIAGWYLLTYMRGRIAGSGDLTSYARVLWTESLARCAIVAIAAVAGAGQSWLLGAAVAIPMFVAAAVGSLTQVSSATPADGPGALLTSDQVAFVIVSVGFQSALNAPSLLVGWRAGNQDVTGAFVAASTYFRAPTILMGGIATYTLVALSHAWGQRDRAAFWAAANRSLRAAALLTAAAIAAISVLAPVLLRVYYGHDLHLPVSLLVALGISSVVAVIGGIAVQPLLAMGRDGVAALAWGLAAVVTVGTVAASNGTDATASFGLVAGPVVALAVAGFGLLRSRSTS